MLAHKTLETGHFRDAVNHFKALLKIENKAEWQQGLSAAYQGRARELQTKGMLKEALAIWQNRAQFCPDAAPDPEHIFVLLHTGKIAEALQRFRTIESSLDSQTTARLRGTLAALHLAGTEGLDQWLTDDDAVIVHGAAARNALHAWCRGNDDEAAALLADIPFRSPYRDWVQVLKALMKAATDPATAASQLQRIADNSPFAAVARAVTLALLPGSEFLTGFEQADDSTRRAAAALRGWSDTRLKLWHELQRAGKNPKAKQLAYLLNRYRQPLGEDWVQQHGLCLLIDGFPRSLKRSPLLAEQGPTPFQYVLVRAWHVEAKHDGPEDIFHAWQAVIEHLQRPADPAPGSDNAVRIALIQRRLANTWNLLTYRPYHWDEEPLAEWVEQGLERSLHYDPDDQPTHLQLIKHYRDNDRLKDARRVLDLTLARWPNAVAVLSEALETAVASNAHKKAAGFARHVLDLDPINSRARDSLLDAHLAHARKQIGKQRADLTEKELQLAAEWVRGEPAEIKLELVRGFLLLTITDRNAGIASLRTLVSRLGSGIAAQLALTLEAARHQQDPHYILKQLGLKQIKTPEKTDLLAFFSKLREVLDANIDMPPPLLPYFSATLQRAAILKLSALEFEVICETLRRCQLDSVREAYARAALQLAPGQPVFELHAFEARHGDMYWDVTDAEFDRLEAAEEKASTTGDNRTAQRIRHTLSLCAAPPSAFDLPPDIPEEVRDLVDQKGIEGLMEALIERITPGANEFDDDIDSPPFLPRRKPVKPQRKKSGGDDATDTDSDQLDFFE